jgi:hypothetical protein
MQPSTRWNSTLKALTLALTGLTLSTSGGEVAAQLAPPSPEREAVHRAALDYLEGFYEGDSTKHLRSIHPTVYKYGFERTRAGAWEGSRMTWPEFHDFTRRVRTNNRPAPANAPKEVIIYEVLDQTASAKVVAYWGIDYILLAKFEGKWMITHILWQTPPAKPGT